MQNLHVVDVVVIGLYLVLCLVIGFYKMGSIKTIREYTLGSGYISTSVLMFTIFATYIGARPTVGSVEKIHSLGLIFTIGVLAEPLFWITTARVYAKNITIFKKAGCMSVSDIMELLYGKSGKWITNVSSIVMSVGAVAAQIAAIGYLFNYFLGISQALGVFLGFGVLVAYSLFGGIRAVALTDTFQGLILLVAIPVACAIAFHEVGGYDGIVSKLPEAHLSIDFSHDNILFLLSMVFFSIIPVSAGTFIQRFLMANDSTQLNKALKINALVSLPFAMIICLIGFIVKAKAPEMDSNSAFFYMIGNYLPIGITGFLITGILAAIMSTADSWLNTTSVLCAHDIAKGLFPNITDKQELIIARISVLIIAALSVTLALTGSSIMALWWMSCNFWIPIILIPLAAGFFRFHTNYKSFLASTTLAIMGVLLGRYIKGEFATVSLLFGSIGCTMGLFGAHYLQKLAKQHIRSGFSTQLSEV